jgi:hypothetical protein
MTAPALDWNSYWTALRHRRIVAMAAVVAFVPIWIALGEAGLLLAFAVLFGAYWHLRAWRCPRCHEPIVGARFSSFPDRCVSCDLPVFGHPVDVGAPALMVPGAFTLDRGTRRFIAWYEMIGGGGLLLLSLWTGWTWWQLVFTVGFAALSIAAGAWLLRDESRGYLLTRQLQWVQLVQLQSPWLTYVVQGGAGLVLSHANGTINLSPGFWSKFIVVIRPGQTFGAAVNFWAALLLLALFQARPSAGKQPAEDGQRDLSARPVA